VFFGAEVLVDKQQLGIAPGALSCSVSQQFMKGVHSSRQADVTDECSGIAKQRRSG
jgi:hypothetical protein